MRNPRTGKRVRISRWKECSPADQVVRRPSVCERVGDEHREMMARQAEQKKGEGVRHVDLVEGQQVWIEHPTGRVRVKVEKVGAGGCKLYVGAPRHMTITRGEGRR